MRFKEVTPGMVIHCPDWKVTKPFLYHLSEIGYRWDGGGISIHEAIERSYLTGETYYIIKNQGRIFSSGSIEHAIELENLVLPDIPETPKFQAGDIVKLKAGLKTDHLYGGKQFPGYRGNEIKELRVIKCRWEEGNLYTLEGIPAEYAEEMLVLVRLYGSTIPASEVLEWLDWLRDYDFEKDPDSLLKALDCRNADEALNQYPPEVIIQMIRKVCGDVIYKGNLVKAYQQIREAKPAGARRIANRVKNEADRVVRCLTMKETTVPLLDDGMIYRWYYVPDENSFAALKISLYDIESSAFCEETDGFPKWVLAVTDSIGYGAIFTSVDEIRERFDRYLKNTEEILGIEPEGKDDEERFLIVNYNDKAASMAVLTKPIRRAEAEKIMKETVLKRLITLHVVSNEAEAKELYAKAAGNDIDQEVPGLVVARSVAVIHFGRDEYTDRYEIVPCAK